MPTARAVAKGKKQYGKHQQPASRIPGHAYWVSWFVKPSNPPMGTSFAFASHEGTTIYGTVFGGFGDLPPRPIPLIGAIQQSFKRVGAPNLRTVVRAVSDPAELEALINDDMTEDLAHYGASGRVTVTGLVPKPAAEVEAERVAQAQQVAAPAAPAHAPAPFVPAAPPPHAIPATEQTAYAIPTIAGPALPFQEAPAKAPPPAAVGPAVQSGETAFVPVIEEAAEAIAAADLPDLSVEQYASLCVDRTMSPGADAAVAERYRVLTQEALQALDTRWSQRFQAEGELYRRWQQAYAQYEAWIRSQR